MKVVGHIHGCPMPKAEKYADGVVIECECGKQYLNKGGLGILGPFQYWERYDIEVKMPPNPGLAR